MAVPAAEIRHLLLSPEARGINFRFRSASVTGSEFQRLSSRFADGPIPRRIRVTTNPAIVGNNLAMYNHIAGENKVNVRSDNILTTVQGRAVFLHECVHALHDLRGQPMMILITEACAFVAEAWYYLNTGTTSLQDAPDQAIFSVTQELRGEYGRAAFATAHQPTTQPATMSNEQFSRVRRVLRSVYRYRGGITHYDGI